MEGAEVKVKNDKNKVEIKLNEREQLRKIFTTARGLKRSLIQGEDSVEVSDYVSACVCSCVCVHTCE